MGRRVGHGRSHLVHNILSAGSAHRQRSRDRTTIESAFVVDHEHDFPFEDIRICDPARYARYVLIGLHLPELAT